MLTRSVAAKFRASCSSQGTQLAHRTACQVLLAQGLRGLSCPGAGADQQGTQSSVRPAVGTGSKTTQCQLLKPRSPHPCPVRCSMERSCGLSAIKVPVQTAAGNSNTHALCLSRRARCPDPRRAIRLSHQLRVFSQPHENASPA